MRNVFGAVVAVATILGAAANEARAQAPVTLTDGVPPAGVYRLQPMHTLTCLGYIGSGSRRYLGLMGGCRATPVDQRTHNVEHFELTILPLPTGGAAILPNTHTRSDSYCLTVARGVVVGPAALEFEWCGPPWGGAPGFTALRPGPSEWRNAHFDQRFRFELATGGGYTLRTANLECVDVRNRGSAAGTEAIQWACNGQDNQRFALTFLGPLDEPAQLAATMSSEAILTLAPITLRADPGFVVETGIAMRREDMSSMQAGAAWAITAPFSFSVEGARTLATTCRIFAANGAVLGESQAQFDVGGPREGVVRIGVLRSAGASGDGARFECLGVLRGLRGGFDWRAWEFQDSGSPTGWTQFVKEDDDTRFWTGAPFTSQVRLRIAG